MPTPLPPAVIGSTEVVWLVAPEDAGNSLVAGDEPADLIRHVERKSA